MKKTKIRSTSHLSSAYRTICCLEDSTATPSTQQSQNDDAYQIDETVRTHQLEEGDPNQLNELAVELKQQQKPLECIKDPSLPQNSHK